MNAALLELIPRTRHFCLISTVTPGPIIFTRPFWGPNFGMRRTWPGMYWEFRCGMTLAAYRHFVRVGKIFRTLACYATMFYLYCRRLHCLQVRPKSPSPKNDNSKQLKTDGLFYKLAAFQATTQKSLASLTCSAKHAIYLNRYLFCRLLLYVLSL